MRISVVVPLYNEEEGAKKTVLGLDRYLKKICEKYEILAIESGSTDNTPKIIDGLAKKLKNVKAIHQKRRMGVGNAIRLGYKNSRYDWVWYRDGDNPYPVEELGKALPYTNNYDAVIAYKTGKRENFTRWFLSLGYNALIKTLFRLKFRDINYHFKFIRKEMLDKLDLRSNIWFIDAEILIELKKNKARVKEIPVRYHIRKEGSSTVTNYPKVVMDLLREIAEYMKRK